MISQFNPPTLNARLAERDMPAQPVVMYQRWQELLFLHWAVEPEVVAEGLPSGLQVDTFDGKAWIGIVPFSMSGVRPRFLPTLKGLSAFPELNLRTYVVDKKGRPGVWFYSLDTPKRLPNWIARTFFHLNYRLARMRVRSEGEIINFQSELWTGSIKHARQCYTWRREGALRTAEAGSLDFFLVERYRLFAGDSKRGRILTGRVHHEPYPIQNAVLRGYSKSLFASNDIPEPDGEPDSVLTSPGVDVRIFPMETVTQS